MGSIVYCCPNCQCTEARYDYGLKMIACRKCGKSMKDFRPSKAISSTRKMKITDLKEIPTAVTCEDASVSPEEFDLLEEMMKRIKPGTFSWNDMDVWITAYPSLDPYLKVDRTTMPQTRPCMGSITVHAQRPDGKQAHFSIADFWDVKEVHHNPEYWWKDFEGENGDDKSVKGHRKFDIKENVTIESKFNDKVAKIVFRGKKPGEKVKPKKKRSPP